MKGAVKGIWVLFGIILLALLGYYFGYVVPAITKPPVTYDGEFRVVGLPTNGLEAPFYTDFGTVTNVAWTNGAQSQAGSARMDLSNKTVLAPGTEHQLDLYIKIDGAVQNFRIESTRLTPAKFDESTYKVVSASLYNYDSGAKMFDIPVKDGEFEFDTGVLARGEYILRVVFRTVSTINLNSITTQTDYNLMKISGQLTTTGDNDEFTDFTVTIRVAP